MALSKNTLIKTLVLAAIVLIPFLMTLLLRQVNVFQGLELFLTDFKSRINSQYNANQNMKPDPNIVVLGIDGITDRYLRLHPELNMTKKVPRSTLGLVIDYLNQQGARAVVFDLEFRDPKPKEDAPFTKAIRQSKIPVYIAERMDFTFESFRQNKNQATGLAVQNNQSQFNELTQYQTLFSPYLERRSKLVNHFLPCQSCAVITPPWQGYYQPFQFISSPLSVLNKQLLSQAVPPLKSDMAFENNQRKQAHPLRNPNERFLDHLCTVNSYQNAYKQTPGFLSKLLQHQLPVSLFANLRNTQVKKLTHCYLYPIVPSVFSAVSGIGISSVDYNDDAYIRDINVLFRGYQGAYFTYIGIRPALDLLNVHHIGYSGSHLYLDKLAIPLQNEKSMVIRWKNPKLALLDAVEQANFPKKERQTLLSQIKTVSASQNNTLLGGGHIYRQLSYIDIYRLATGEKLPTTDAQRLLNIPYHHASGIFSFKNKIVVVGNTIQDIHRTPVSQTMFGPEILASTLDMILNKAPFIQPVPFLVQAALNLLVILAICWAVVHHKKLNRGILTAGLIISLYLTTNLALFMVLGYKLDLAVSFLCQVVVLIAALIYRYYIKDIERKHLSDVFSKYVSPQIMETLIQNPVKAMDILKGTKKELTVLFCDIEGFTTIFENAPVEQMADQLNQFFEGMIEIILKHGGTYDKYMGDAIMAFFGAPADLENHAEKACQAAIEMQEKIQILNVQWREMGYPELKQCIGISSGEMFVGNFGSKRIKNFTVMGKAVNLGSRLEGLTRKLNHNVLISNRTAELVENKLKTQSLGLKSVKGFTQKVEVFTVSASERRLMP
ncbi:MAG: adenylate/guanylate cyclase domain-containing protein [Cyanobacteria bacterium P01_H01_bin.74]